MKLSPILCVFIFLLSCSSNTLLNDDITNLTLSEKKDIVDSKIEETEIIMQKPEKLTVLFFKNIVYDVAPVNNKKVENKIVKERVTSDDFLVVADWMINNIRFIKVRNVKTEEETLLREGTTVGNIELIERNLFFYKFKINEEIIEVKR